MTQVVRRLLPTLYFHHRGFFIMAVGLALTHLWAGLDEVLPHAAERHSYAVWAMHNSLMPDGMWGTLHLLLATAMLIGIGAKGEPVAIRIVCAVSATMFFVLTVTFAISAFVSWPVAPFTLVGLCALAFGSAMAVLLEPPVNPANLRTK